LPDAARSIVAIVAIGPGEAIILVRVDGVAAHGAIPRVTIVVADLIDAALGVAAVKTVGKLTDVALVLANGVAAACAVPG
jgi:hypothetical protein